MSSFSILAEMSPENIELVNLIGRWVAAILTLCIFSFLYKDNPFYKFAEHVMVGLAMGFFGIVWVLNIFEIQWWDRVILGKLGPADTLFGSPMAFRLSMIIPAVFGSMMVLRVVPKVAWISRWSIALLVGITSGITIPTLLQARVTTHLNIGTSLPLNYMAALTNGTEASFTSTPGWEVGVPILVIGTICALIYFFFSIPHRGTVGHLAKGGIWIMMIGFGASFGYTVMARLSLLIGRVLFLLKDWLGLIS